jgi:DNA-directed RNA polymerase specialized sigma24 family protein
MNMKDEYTRDDLLQEGKIALLQHIRAMEDESQIFLGKKKIRAAMFEYARSMALVNIPANKFCREVRKFSRNIWVFPDGIPGECEEDEWVFGILYKQFLTQLSREERFIFQMKVSGKTQKQIARMLRHKYEMIVSRRMGNCREQLRGYLLNLEGG